MRLPETKRRRLFLKQERATQKDAFEVSEGSTYQSEIGLGAEADIETIPDPVSKPTFGTVQKLKNTRPLFITFDLETTGLNKEPCLTLHRSVLWIWSLEKHSLPLFYQRYL